jgi:hypothetical protein
MPLKAKNTRKYSNPISAREIGDTCAMIRPKAQLVKGVPAGAGSLAGQSKYVKPALPHHAANFPPTTKCPLSVKFEP